MSNALAIAAVTAALKDLIGNGLLGLDLSSIGSVTVSALPPDRIATGMTEPNQLNLFLYQVSPNIGWRNQALPSRDGGGTRISNPPLALDLHYMLTAYGAEDLSAEALLGFAMQFLHETPMLSRAQLRTVLGPPSPPFGNLSALSLADQIECLKITPQFLGAEELSKLWTAMQARYRPSMAYQVSVVLIESDAATRAALPVLKRGSADRGPVTVTGAGPSLNRVRPAQSDLLPAARLGDELLVSGSGLQAGGLSAIFENDRTGSRQTLLTSAGSGGSDDELRVQLPSAADAGAMAAWGIGMYSVRLRSAMAGIPALLSNAVPLALSPRITVSPLAAAAGDIAVTVICSPRLHPVQHAGARLLFGSIEIAPDAIVTPADDTQSTTLNFTVRNAVAGSFPVRLRVDGVDSLPALLVPNASGFDFDPLQTVVVA